MKLSKRILRTSGLLLVLGSNLFAQELYTIQNKTLIEALEIISKKSNLSYISNDKVLDSQRINNIKNVEGVENVLKLLLEGTGLKAIIKNDAIIILEESAKKDNNLETSLGTVDIIDSGTRASEGSSLYTVDSMNTATRMNLSVKETPQSVTVITNQNMKDKGLLSLNDVTDNIVGINSPIEDSERIFMTSRGFEIDYYQIDGMPTSYTGETQQDMAMFDRVEVVRGANGLMSGAGNPAASINLVRKHANSKEFETNLSLKAGSWNYYRSDIDLSMPLTEDGSVRSRTVISYEDKESFRDFYKKDRKVFYSIIDADIKDSSRFSIGASYQKDNAKGATWGGIPAFYDNYEKTDFATSTSFTPKWATMPTTTKTVFSDFEHIFDNDIKLNANYSFLQAKTQPKMALFGYNTFANKTTGNGAGIIGWLAEVENKTSTFDINTLVPFSLAEQEHEIITGIMHSKRKYFSLNRKRGNTLTGNINNWNPNIDEYIPTGDPYVTYDNNTEETALYTAGRFSLGENAKLIAGTRITKHEYERGKTSWQEPINYEHKNVITPYLGLTYNIGENHTIYTSYSDIFKPQSEVDKNGDYLDPIEGKNYEAGIKGEYLNKKLISSFTYFRIKQNNVAQKDGSNLVKGTTKQAYVGAEGVVSRGFEFEILGKATEDLDVGLSVSHFQAKDKDGKEVSTITPRTEVMLSSKYRLNNMTFGGTLKWKSDIYSQTSPLPKLSEGNVLTFDTMAAYEFSKKLSGQLNINNLFNKKYYVNFPYGTQYVYGEPRKMTFSLNYKF